MRALFPITLLFLQFFVSCSHLSSGPAKITDLNPEQMERLNKEALVIASQRLEQMVSQAKNNTQSINYLASDLFLKANMSLLEGDYATASVLFKYVADLAPEDAFVQKKYAISLIRVGNLEESQLVLEKLYHTGKEEKVGMILAGVYTGLDKEEQAITLYKKLLAANSKNEDACIFLGKAFSIAKDMPKAYQQLNECAHKNPKSGIYDYYMGKMSIDQAKLDQAVSYFKKSHTKQPDLTQSVAALGFIYEDRELFADAIKLYEKHLINNPSDAPILNRLVQVLFAKEKYQEVIPYAERLSDLEPDNLNLKVKLGVLYTDAKKFPEAISVFKDLLAVAPQSDKILYYLGAIHQEMKEFQDSIEYFNQIPSSSSLYTDSSVQMANMLSALAQTEFFDQEGDKFQKQFMKLVNNKFEEHKDLRVEFSIVKAGFYEGTSQYKKAMETMMVVQDEKSFSTQHKYYLANLYEKEQKFEESTNLIMSIIEKEPKNAHAWNFLGYSMLVRGNEMDRAFEYIQTALKISPDDGYIRDSLGWYYFKKGEIKKAQVELEFALSKVPDDIEILKHLAVVHAELKDLKKAKTYLEAALKHVRFTSDRHEIMASLEKLETDRIPASGKMD
ncbi:MAG: tetratricopeptide repeat protein [Bdellovibrionales bacterium]|nr:tetratricopeptide repeat protein [Bdellovibrionales bacterium]